jgi:LemA protein
MKIALIVFSPLLLLAGFVLFSYNRLVGLRNRYRKAFSEVDVQLKRRHDLIPNLVETAKGYLQHERGTLEAVIAARAAAMTARQGAAARPGDPSAMNVLGTSENKLTGALARLLAVSEQYPQLKANQTMALLMEELTTTENRVAFARQAYNDVVMFYNTAIETFPTRLIAGIFNFSPAEFFSVDVATEKQVPAVSFA